MATENLRFWYPTGQTLTVKITATGSTYAAARTVNATEQNTGGSDDAGTYLAPVTTGETGVYEATVYSGSTPVIKGYATLAGTARTVDIKDPVDARTIQGVDQTGADVGGVVAKVGTPVALDGGTASLAGMLTKLADDNGGATFDATYDSLNKLQGTVTAGVGGTVTASSDTITTGTRIGSTTYANTYLSNGTYFTTAPVTPAVGGYGLLVYLQFSLSSSQYLDSVIFSGYFAAGAARVVQFVAWNYTLSAWDLISDSATQLSNGNTNVTRNIKLLPEHRKADGEVRIGFRSTSTTTADRLNVDQCVLAIQTAGASAAQIADAVYLKMSGTVYSNGIWINPTTGTDGYTVGVNGLSNTPVRTLACAYSLAASLGFNRLYFTAGSQDTAVSLSQSAAGWRFIGPAVIDINGQSIADAVFEDVYEITNTGAATGDDAKFSRCGIGDGAFNHGYFWDCMLKNSTGITLTAANEYFFFNCKDATDNAGNPATFTFAAGAVLVMRDYRGGVELKSMASGDEAKIDGAFRLVIDGSCSGGDITARGFAASPTGLAAFLSAGGHFTESARFGTDNRITANADQIGGSATAATALKQTALCVATGTVQTDAGNSETSFKIDSTLGAKASDYFGDASGGLVLQFVAGAGNEYQGRRVTGFNGSTDVVTVKSAFAATPTAGDAFVLLGRIEV